MDRSASQDAAQRSEGAPPQLATDALPRPTSAEPRGMHAAQQRDLQSHQPLAMRVQQLGTPGPRPGSSSPPPPQQMRASEEAFGEAFGGNNGGGAGAGAGAEVEQQQSRQTLQLQQPQQHSSSPSPGESFRAEAGGGVDAQQRVQAPSHPHHPQQPQPQPQLQQAHPQHQPSEALTQAPLSDQPETAQQQQQLQQQQPWPQQQAVQTQRDMSAQQQQQQQQQQRHQQPQPQAQARTEAERWKPSASLLSGYVPPVANTQVDVPVLMQQTSAAIARWGDLQKNLDVRSDTATGNLAAQAQARSSLKRDLTNLTQLADAQTRHIQRMKVRQMQSQQVSKPPSQGWFPPGGAAAAGSTLTPTGTPGSVARGGATTGEGFNFSPKPQVLNQLGASPVAALRGASIAAPSHAASGSVGALLMQQGGSRAGVPHGLSTTVRGDVAEDVRTAGRTSEWVQMSAASSSRPSAAPSGTPSPPLQPQHAMPSQQRLQVVKERLDRTEPRNKWVVLVDASLRLSPDEGPMFKHLCMMIQGFLSNYNGAVGAEVAQALRSCLDPRVFDTMNIKRSQERLADVYSRWAQRGGR